MKNLDRMGKSDTWEGARRGEGCPRRPAAEQVNREYRVEVHLNSKTLCRAKLGPNTGGDISS